MKVGIIGGTGNIGEGLARRICISGKHDVIIGSRDPAKAETAAGGVTEALSERGVGFSACSGGANADCCDADIIILSLPFDKIESTIEAIGKEKFENKVVVSLINPMLRYPEEKCFLHDSPAETSAALAIKKMLPESAKLTTGFNNVAAGKWMRLDEELDYSVVVCGDDKDAKDTVRELVADVSKLQPLDGGPLKMSNIVESITPLVITLAMNNGLKDVGVYFR
ncbi:NADPH-dependent F420 reductase [Methanofollis fontis]|uniref:NADPH-dependent F420 reductase n=1 Tax=Methanofollis fontis TaxID=2052832 RepID=A0A483CZQ3_9EURY|nr:NADPH-dependent F420 reductase [Methanofollis fontis]TAJ45629.1 NADPH-dependent F420 reductase [Methanofollis fontis]